MPTSTCSREAEGALAVPGDALRYILYQRTNYLALPRRRQLYRLLHRFSPWPPITTAVALEAACRPGQVRRSFRRDMEREFAEILPWLPERATALLDIGCGVGGIDVLLHRHYGGVALYLLDKSRTEPAVYYGFKRRAAFYNSLATTRRMLEGNSIPPADIHLREVTSDCRLDVPAPLDLVVSLISWGFHYPVSTYAEQVHARLRPGGRAILDVRRGTSGEEELRALFRCVDVVSETPKKRRVAVTK